jgi:hypothetical protein
MPLSTALSGASGLRDAVLLKKRRTAAFSVMTRRACSTLRVLMVAEV